jgi:Uma2 family endonuclease
MGIVHTRLTQPFQFGEGGPGGWIIILEVEIMPGQHLLVPDLSGWKREHFPGLPKENRISAPPDWVCEILSPGTARLDRVRKMPVYAQFRVPYLWLIDLTEKSLEVFKLESGKWVMLAGFADNLCAR